MIYEVVMTRIIWVAQREIQLLHDICMHSVVHWLAVRAPLSPKNGYDKENLRILSYFNGYLAFLGMLWGLLWLHETWMQPMNSKRTMCCHKGWELNEMWGSPLEVSLVLHQLHHTLDLITVVIYHCTFHEKFLSFQKFFKSKNLKLCGGNLWWNPT